MLPIAGGMARAYEALHGPRPHACVCPLDADGHCLCSECIRLGIHDRHEDPHDDEAAAVDALRAEAGPVLASACAPAPDEDPPPLALERATLPPGDPVIAPPCGALLEHALAPSLRARTPEPSVPPPRLGSAV